MQINKKSTDWIPRSGRGEDYKKNARMDSGNGFVDESRSRFLETTVTTIDLPVIQNKSIILMEFEKDNFNS